MTLILVIVWVIAWNSSVCHILMEYIQQFLSRFLWLLRKHVTCFSTMDGGQRLIFIILTRVQKFLNMIVWWEF